MSTAHELRLYHRTQVAAHVLKKFADAEVAATGLSTAQLAVLAVIDRQGPVLQRRVARQLAINESAVTALIRRLESDGLVARADGPDRRSRLLTLTAAGRRLAQRGEQAFVAVNDVLDRALDAGEREQLAALLDRVRAAVDGA